MFKMKEQTPEEELSAVEIGSLSNRGFKVMIVRTFKEFGRRLDEQSEKLEIFNRVRKYKEDPNRDEGYNNCNEKYTRRNQW